MRGISTTLVIIITAVILLVAALVLLTIFGGGMAPVADITTQTSICRQQGASSCQATGNLPPTWSVPMPVRVAGQTATEMKSCADLLGGCSTCSGCGFPTPGY